MTTISDLARHKVLQRGSGGTALVEVGPDFLEVLVAGTDGQTIIDWTAGPIEIPCGGPYVITGRRADHETEPIASDVFVGDVWILAGQSNMQGAGRIDDPEAPHPAVRVFGMDRRWQPPVEPLHRLWDSPDPVHHGLWTEEQRAAIDSSTLDVGAGGGVAFANEMIRLTGVPVGLVPAAHGGTSLADWSPDRGHLGGESLYGSMLASVRQSGGCVAGMLWYQGESEHDSDAQADDYCRASRAVFDALRHDIGNPELPIILAQLNLFPIVRDRDAARRWTTVRVAQNDLEALGAQGLVATTDLSRIDPIHLDAPSLRRLGRRFARVASGQTDSIRIGRTDVERRYADFPDVPVWFEVRVHFDGVTGGLAPGEHSGFSLRTATGDAVPGVWRVQVDAEDRHSVVVHAAARDGEDALELWYGWGTDTFCTLVDEADQAVPAFGPVRLA